MSMYLRTLGGLWLEGSEFRRPKPLLLLAYLALEGAKPRRYLAELFFMEASDRMNSLSRALSYLRQEVPGVVEADNKKVWATISCDAAELLNLTDSKQFEKCLELYGGTFAVDYDLELSGELEEWLYGTREILAAKARNAFLHLGESEASKGSFSQAAHLAEKAYKLRDVVELEPDDFGRLYNLLYAGNSPLAAEVKKEAEGFEIPLELSREEAKAQLSETSEIKLETANNLPLPKSSFVGRDQELVAVATQLAKVDCRLLTLHGTGGVGKSRLALQAAYDQLKSGSWEGVYFIALDALNSHELIGSSIAETLGLELQGQDDTLTQVQRFIAKKRLLFVLDNYEHLMAGATLTSKLLASCPNLKILVTSRERLNVEEEWVLTLEGLTVPEATPDTLNEAQHFEAVDMFLQRAKRARLDFAISEGDLPHVLKICRLVNGLPLGIELAAVWVKSLPLSEIAKEIESNLSILETPSKNVAERHQSIRAAFEHSWKLLTEKEQEVLRRLSVFVGGFRREAAAEVAGATLPILASLVDKSLLRVSENGRYDRHFLIYELAMEKLAANSEELVQVKERHCQLFLGLISNVIHLEREVIHPGYKKTIAEIEQELENIRTAWFWAFDYQVNLILPVSILEMKKYFDTKGYFEVGIHWFNKSLELINNHVWDNQKINTALLLEAKAWLHFRTGKIELARALVGQAMNLILPVSVGTTGYYANCCNTIGVIHTYTGDYEKAKAILETGIKHVRNDLSKASLITHLADAEEGLGHSATAEGYLLEALNTFERYEDAPNIIDVCSRLGKFYTTIKRELAHAYLERALQLSESYGYAQYTLEAKNNLAAVFLELLQFKKAHTLLLEALILAKTVNHPSTEAKILINLARLDMENGDYGQARYYLHKSIQIAWDIDAIPIVLEGLLWFAILNMRSNEIHRITDVLTLITTHVAARQTQKEFAQTLLDEYNLSHPLNSSKFSPDDLRLMLNENFLNATVFV